MTYPVTIYTSTTQIANNIFLIEILIGFLNIVVVKNQLPIGFEIAIACNSKH